LFGGVSNHIKSVSTTLSDVHLLRFLVKKMFSFHGLF